MTNDQLKSLIQESGLRIAENKLILIDRFTDLFIEKNKLINLTKINNREEFLIKHIIDSMILDKYVEMKPNKQVADLGTGGGLPGLLLAIMHPENRFTLIDSVQKKIRCIEEFASQLKLNNVSGLSDRLEELGQNKKYRESFDIVIARALAPLPVLLELAIPLVKTSGIFVAMKGPGYLEELSNAANAMKELKIIMPKIEKYELPKSMGTHYLLLFKKDRPTSNAYPRRVGVPSKHPL
jgi:16S rRNA (guanine527-N7)-methyltransferase